jgi:hypothetical protein
MNKLLEKRAPKQHEEASSRRRGEKSLEEDHQNSSPLNGNEVLAKPTQLNLIEQERATQFGRSTWTTSFTR